MKRITAFCVLCLVTALAGRMAAGAAAEWPQYRADAARSGYVDGQLPAALSLNWSLAPRHRPAPAWLGQDTRMPFDRAFQPVIAGGMLIYGSSADGKIHALDAAGGAERWTFFTGGPVRFAPACWNGRVYAASDDGRLYCLDGASGKLLWDKRGGPGNAMLLGNEAMISRWPARGGPVVRDGVVYFAAGIWPSEGIYVYALDAATGKTIWCNDGSGRMLWDQPHRGSRAVSGIAPQGYLAAGPKQLFVPNGRGMAAALDLAAGKLDYFHLQLYGKVGGGGVIASADHFFNGSGVFDAASGLTCGTAPKGELIAAAPDRVVMAADGQLTINRWVAEKSKDSTTTKMVLRSMPGAAGAQAKAVAGRLGKALAFAGEDYLETPSFGFDYNRITISAWVNPGRLDGRFTVFDNRNVADCPGLEIGRGSGKGANRVVVITPGIFVAETNNDALAAGKWQHIVYTRNGPGMTHKIYVDGVEQNLAVAKTGPYASTATPKDVGRRGSGKQFFQGAIDEVAVYDRALTGAEVARLFQAQGPNPVREGLVLDLPMELNESGAVADLSGSRRDGAYFSKGGLAAPHEVSSIIMVGGDIVVGGPGKVSIVRTNAPAQGWSADVDGTVYGLAFADGRLYASTDRGMIYCFGEKGKAPVVHQPPRPADAPYGDNALYAAAAEEIIKKTGVKDGYAADLGCGDGALAYELAKRTNLKIYAVDSDPERVRAAREKLDAAGLYGTRVMVWAGDTRNSNLPNYFADLVVSARSLNDENQGEGPERNRLTRPWGGAACTGRAGSMECATRGALEGAGEWTHQYCDAGNTAISKDRIAKSPLGMLWFGDYEGITMASRHGRPPAPLFSAGRLFFMGRDGVHAISAYNGRRLWDYDMPEVLKTYDQEHLLGTAITGGSFCLEGGALYARYKEACHRIDAATGKKLGEFPLPGGTEGKDHRWGYLAVDGGVLFGSTAIENHIVQWSFKTSDMEDILSESSSLFGMDTESGQVLWTYKAKHSIRHNAIAAGGGRIYLIDRPMDANDQLSSQAKRKGKKAAAQTSQPLGELVAIDAKTGKIAWRVSEEVFGTMLALSLDHGLLLMSYQRNHAFRLASEQGGRMAALRLADGRRVWDKKIEYNERPILNGATIYAMPGAWDLLTGEPKDFNFSRSYGCGIVAGSVNLLTFRSGTLGFRDLTRPDSETENYGGIRPGCWINAIPAGGLVLQPDATEKCTCGYLNKAFMALQPMGE